MSRTAAPIVACGATTVEVAGEPLASLYVQVEATGRPDVGAFLSEWKPCCEAAVLEWQAIRRPAAALVSLELSLCHSEEPRSLRLVFDVRRDRAALEALAATEALVVGSRKYGAFANLTAAYGIDGNTVRHAVEASLDGLSQLAAAS